MTATVQNFTAGIAVGDSEYREILTFLYHEAALLDARRFAEWLTLLTPDIRLQTLLPVVFDQTEENRPERPTVTPLFQEDLGTLRFRVEQWSTPGYTVAENPPPGMKRFISNVMATAVGDDQYVARTSILVYRGLPPDVPAQIFVGDRTDTLRRVDGQLRLSDRVTLLCDPTLTSRNVGPLL